MDRTGEKIAAAALAAVLLGTLVLGTVLPYQAVRRQRDSAPVSGTVPQGPFIALTFDDGPKTETTVRLLDGLAQRGVHATFFVLGVQVEGREDLIRRMDAEGHQIGLHTAHHAKLTGLTAEGFYEEVDSLRATLTEILGVRHFMLRPPYGMVNPSVQQWAGAPIILWSVDPQDWSDRDSARQAEHLVSRARDGDILLLHDIYDSSVDAALETVDRLMEQGFLFVTVEELFALRGIKPEDGTIYRCLLPGNA